MKQQKSLECAPDNNRKTENPGIILPRDLCKISWQSFGGVDALSSDTEGSRRHFDNWWSKEIKFCPQTEHLISVFLVTT